MRKVQRGFAMAVSAARQPKALSCFCHSHLCLASGSLSITAAPVPFLLPKSKAAFSKEEGLVFEVSMPINRTLLSSSNKNSFDLAEIPELLH